MKNIRLTIATLGIMLGVGAPVLIAAQPVAADRTTAGQNCTVSIEGSDNSENLTNSRFHVANGVATITVNVGGDSFYCHETLNVTSWRAPYGATGFLPAASQTQFDNTTVDVNYGTRTISVKVPTDCAYQIDLSNSGFNPAKQAADGYTFGNLLAYDNNFTGVCQKPTSTPTPTPTPPVVTTTSASTPAQPTALVNTGPGNIAELFALVAAAGAIAHRLVVRKMLNR